MAVAVLVFAAAAAFAMVRATGSEHDTGPSGQEPAVVVAVQEETVQAGEQAEGVEASVTTDTERAGETDQVAARQSIDAERQQASQAAQAQSVEAEQETQQSTEQSTEQSTVPDEADNPLTGFIVPIRGACITEFEGHLPAAPRAYRNDGVHEGLDFYQWAACTNVNVATEILAAKAGIVVRADVDYVEITPSDWARFEAASWQGDDILDRLRGRQVWIDHGRGIVTRYAHLSEIAEGIVEGVEVEQGQLIGYPGESGQQEVYAAPGTDIHLHFEIRIADGWLGQGMSPQEARELYLQAFGLAE